MKAFTIKVTGCRNCPYFYERYFGWNECNHPDVRTTGTGNCRSIFCQNQFKIYPSCPMYNQAIEQGK